MSIRSEQISSGASENGGNFSFEPQISGRDQSPGFDELNSEIEEARLQSIALERNRTAIKDKIAKKEKKKDKKKKKKNLASSDSESGTNNMSEVDATEQVNGAASNQLPPEMLPSQRQLEDDARDREEEEERKRNREPAIVFKDIDVSSFLSFFYCINLLKINKTNVITIVIVCLGYCRIRSISATSGWKVIKR